MYNYTVYMASLCLRLMGVGSVPDGWIERIAITSDTVGGRNRDVS